VRHDAPKTLETQAVIGSNAVRKQKTRTAVRVSKTESSKL